MLEVMENRISRRAFLKENLSEKECTQICSYLRGLNAESGLTMEFVEDGSAAFASLSKSYGIFSNVRSLVLMKGKFDDDHLKEKVGYYGEEFILNQTSLGLGSCWVGATFDKSFFKIAKDEKLICVIVIGKVVEPTFKEKMIRKTISKTRKDARERLITDTKDLPSWMMEGLEAVRLAPSAKNTQKPIFEYKNGDLFANVADDYEFDLVDLGIAKKHFELVTDGIFDFGNGGVFRLNEEFKKI